MEPVDTVRDKDGNALRMDKRLLRAGESRIKLIVTGEPAKAGIDPIGKLIGRDVGDNLLRCPDSQSRRCAGGIDGPGGS